MNTARCRKFCVSRTQKQNKHKPDATLFRNTGLGERLNKIEKDNTMNTEIGYVGRIYYFKIRKKQKSICELETKNIQKQQQENKNLKEKMC